MSHQVSNSDPSALSRRLAAVRETGLLDAPAELSLERYVRIASLALGVPVTLVSLVDHDRQFFAASTGLPSPWDQTRQTPLSHSFCQHVVADAKPFLVNDSSRDSRVEGNLAITDLSVSAYAGMPITAGSEDIVGSFCAIDHQPRQWSSRDLEILSELAALVSQELELRRNAQRINRAEKQIASLNEELVPLSPDLAGRVDMIAHDLRTPFQTMSIVSSLLRTHPTLVGSEALLGLLDRLDRNLVQAGAMVASLSRIDPDAPGRDESSAIEIGPMVDAVCEDLRPLNGAISVQIHRNADPLIRASDVGLRRCLFNLITNAMRFAESTVQVSLIAGNDAVSIIVEDDGPGLPEGCEWRKVWEPGVTFHGAEGRSNKGLGLAITRELAIRYGGRVSASRSALGGGQFELHFPLHT